jgi:hypothetical protein
MATQADQATDADWEVVAPLLESALDRLGTADRDAVLLRFIQGKSHRDVGTAMGISEDAARKRIERALARLRSFFVARGVTVPAVAIGSLLATHAVRAAPAAVAAAAALASPAGGAVTLAGGVIAAMAWTKAKLIAAAVAAMLLVGTTTLVTVRYAIHSRRAANPQAQAAPPALPAKPVIAQGAPQNPAANPVPAQTIEGTVYGLDGEPLPGASVYLATPKTPYTVYAGAQKITPQVTGADGKFSFARPGDDWQIVVAMPDGFAQVRPEELAKSPMIFIRPWGRIDGRLLERNAPLPNQPVMVGLSNWHDDDLSNCVTNQIEVKTDKDGRFVLDRVPPGRMNVAHRDPAPGWGKWSKWDLIDVQPGKVSQVEMGAIGRPVVGRLVVPPGSEAKVVFKADQRHSWTIEANRSDVPRMSLPWDYGSMPPHQRHRIREAWERTPEGQQSLKFMHAESTTINPDGSFRFEVLRPGKYGMYVRSLELDPANSMFEDVASASAFFTVPELPPGQRNSDQPIDVGAIQLTMSPRIIVGDPAPPLEVKTADGKAIKLEDFRGKLLVLHLHWQEMPDQSLAGLKKTYDTFSKDPLFGMLSIHIDARPDQVDALTREQDLKWPQALAARNSPTLPEGYRSGPALIHLIDPDGRVIAKVLDADKLETAVAKALLERR